MWQSLRRRSIILLTLLGLTVGGLAALILVAIDASRTTYQRKGCESRLRALALGVQASLTLKDRALIGTVPSRQQPPEKRLSWYIPILHFSDGMQGISYLFERDQPWDSEENRIPRFHVYPIGSPDFEGRLEEPVRCPYWTCPSHPEPAAPGMPPPTPYVGIAGLGPDAAMLPEGHPRAGVFGYDRRTHLEDITDGASATLMLAETASEVGPWTAGGPTTVRGLDPSRAPYIGKGRPFGGRHRGGANVAMADGSVRFVSESVDPRVLEALSTIAGGETVDKSF